MIDNMTLFTMSLDSFRREVKNMNVNELVIHLYYAHGYIKEVERLRKLKKEGVLEIDVDKIWDKEDGVI